MSTPNEEIINIDETATLLAASMNEHSITLPEAAALTANFRNAASNPNVIIGGSFSRAIIDQILAQNGCQGIRYYYGLDSNSVPHIILVGVDASGNDIEQGVLAEKSRLCPPSCSQANQLNGQPVPLNIL